MALGAERDLWSALSVLGGFKSHSAPRFSRETGNLGLCEKCVKHWEGQTKLVRGEWHRAHQPAYSALHHENTNPEMISLIKRKVGTQMEL